MAQFKWCGVNEISTVDKIPSTVINQRSWKEFHFHAPKTSKTTLEMVRYDNYAKCPYLQFQAKN